MASVDADTCIRTGAREDRGESEGTPRRTWDVSRERSDRGPDRGSGESPLVAVRPAEALAAGAPAPREGRDRGRRSPVQHSDRPRLPPRRPLSAGRRVRHPEPGQPQHDRRRPADPVRDQGRAKLRGGLPARCDRRAGDRSTPDRTLLPAPGSLAGLLHRADIRRADQPPHLGLLNAPGRPGPSGGRALPSDSVPGGRADAARRAPPPADADDSRRGPAGRRDRHILRALRPPEVHGGAGPARGCQRRRRGGPGADPDRSELRSGTLGDRSVRRADRRVAASRHQPRLGPGAVLRRTGLRRLRRDHGSALAGRPARPGGSDHCRRARLLPALRRAGGGGNHGLGLALGLIPAGPGSRHPGVRPHGRAAGDRRSTGAGAGPHDGNSGDRVRGYVVPVWTRGALGASGREREASAGRGGGPRGAERRRQVHHRRPSPPLLGPDARPHLLERAGHPGGRPGRPEGSNRLRAAGAHALLRHRLREHRLRPAGRQPRGDRGGGSGGARPRVHRAPAQRLPDPGRREGGAAVGRAAAAAGDRPGRAQGAPHPDPGRGDQQPRHRERTARRGGARQPDGGPHDADHRPPPSHRAAGRPAPRPGSRPRRRGGFARRTAPPGRPVRPWRWRSSPSPRRRCAPHRPRPPPTPPPAPTRSRCGRTSGSRTFGSP